MIAGMALRRVTAVTGVVGPISTRWSAAATAAASPVMLRRESQTPASASLVQCYSRLHSTAAPNPKKEETDKETSKKTAAAAAADSKSGIKIRAKPLEDFLGRDPASRPAVILYQNHQKWKVRALGTFAVSQGSYWAFVAYDTTKRWWHDRSDSAATASIDQVQVSDVVDASSSGFVDPIMAIGLITHPGWAVFGAGFAISLFGVVHLVSSHLIAQIAVPRERGVGYLEVITHDYFGQLSRPVVWRAAEMAVHGKYLQASSTDSFVGILAPGFKARFLLETDMGEFAPRLHVIDSEGEFVRGSTLKRMVEEACISVDEPQADASPGFQPLAPLKSSIVDRYDKKGKRGRKRR